MTSGQSGATGDQVLRRRREAVEVRIAMIVEQLDLLSRRAKAAEQERLRKQREVEEVEHWRAFDRLRREPSAENAKAAKRAFLVLAKRHHPDSGGTHEGFLRSKTLTTGPGPHQDDLTEPVARLPSLTVGGSWFCLPAPSESARGMLASKHFRHCLHCTCLFRQWRKKGAGGHRLPPRPQRQNKLSWRSCCRLPRATCCR